MAKQKLKMRKKNDKKIYKTVDAGGEGKRKAEPELASAGFGPCISLIAENRGREDGEHKAKDA